MEAIPWSPEIAAFKLCICLIRYIIMHLQNRKIRYRLILRLQKMANDDSLSNVTEEDIYKEIKTVSKKYHIFKV